MEINEAWGIFINKTNKLWTRLDFCYKSRQEAEKRIRQMERRVQQEATARQAVEEKSLQLEEYARQEVVARHAAEERAKQESAARAAAEQRARKAEQRAREAEARHEPALEQHQQEQRPDFAMFRDLDTPWCPEMVVLPAGEFLMGSPGSDSEAYSDEKPSHRVQIGYRLAVGQNPVTFEEWDAYVAEGGADRYPDDQGWGRGRRPVINVSWNDAKQYVAWLSRKTGQAYRLLSEAEWEYAARAGTTTNRWWGNDITLQDANYDYNNGKTTEVGSYPENPFKLYDVLGNVWEWVEDYWNRDYHGAPEDGAVWITEDRGQRVLRGGAWDSSPKFIRSAYRNKNSAEARNNYFGLRVARTFPETGHRPARSKQVGRRQR